MAADDLRVARRMAWRMLTLGGLAQNVMAGAHAIGGIGVLPNFP